MCLNSSGNAHKGLATGNIKKMIKASFEKPF